MNFTIQFFLVNFHNSQLSLSFCPEENCANFGTMKYELVTDFDYLIVYMLFIP